MNNLFVSANGSRYWWKRKGT